VTWLEWFAYKHPVLIHLPVATAVLLPVAVLASLRPGRGIRPWWLVSRFLAWWGLVGMLVAAIAGYMVAHRTALLPEGVLLAPAQAGQTGLLRIHQALVGASLLLGLLTLRSLYRPRQDHQNIGFLALFCSLLWSAAVLGVAHFGDQLVHPVRTEVVYQPVAAPAPAPAAVAPSESGLPVKILDYRSLEPIQPEFVKTTVHGLRWIRTWVSPGSVEAYRTGQPLPPGTLVVMVSQEDKWGRPGPDSGPLYGLEVLADGQSKLSFYWGRVPEGRRGEVGGVDRAYWHGNDANLEGCMGCHAQGMAPPRERSRLQAFRKKEEAVQ
jgi:hypothetical protein